MKRRHFGRGLDGITPLENLKKLIPWISPAIALFPVVLLKNVYDTMPSYPSTKSGNHVQAYYGRSSLAIENCNANQAFCP